MKLEAIIICRDYSDFLEHTLPENLQHFDDVVVVTHPDDKQTQKVCSRNSVDCVQTHLFTERGHSLNKGAAINVGIDHLQRRDWLLHIDADIVLPHSFRRMLDKHQLNRKNIYGSDRLNVYGYEAWLKIKNKLVPHYQDKWFIDPGFSHAEALPENCRLGARVVHMEYGWIPIGFFQLWHSSQPHRYNYKRGAAAGTDVMFPVNWAREDRILLPEVVCYHLDSEKAHRIGTNWKGRKSKKFGPETGRLL